LIVPSSGSESKKSNHSHKSTACFFSVTAVFYQARTLPPPHYTQRQTTIEVSKSLIVFHNSSFSP
jgi:hypothetical protein